METSAAVINPPTIRTPIATTKAIQTRYTRVKRETLYPSMQARSDEIPANTKRGIMVRTIKKIIREMSTELIIAKKGILEIFPIRAMYASFSGKNKKAIASDEAKTTAVSASNGSFVRCSRSHIRKIPPPRKSSAPKDISKPYNKPSETPGNVKWPSAPPMSAIRLVTISDPIYPAIPPMHAPIMRTAKN